MTSDTGTPPRIGVIVAAGGTGSRFGRSEGKQLAPLAGRTVVGWSLQALARLPGVRALVVAGEPDREAEYWRHLEDVRTSAPEMRVVPGAATRQGSVAAALDALSPDCGIVVVHDGARPLVTTELAASLVSALLAAPEADGVVAGHPSVDTLKRVEAGRIVRTLDRAEVWTVQTPQVFRAEAIRGAHVAAREAGFLGTDDAALVEREGGNVLVVEGPRDNIKITLTEDIAVAEAILAIRAREAL